MKRIIILGELSQEDQQLITERLEDTCEVSFYNPDEKVLHNNTESIAAKGINVHTIIGESLKGRCIVVAGHIPTTTSSLEEIIIESKRQLEKPIILHCNDKIDYQIFDDKPKRNKYDKPYKYHK